MTKSASFQIHLGRPQILAWFSSSKSELQHEISFKTVMDLESFTTEQMISLFKRRSVPQEALDLLRGMQSSLKRQSNTTVSVRIPSVFSKFKMIRSFSLLDNDIDGSSLLLLRDDVDEFKAVVPKSGHRLLIKWIIKEELTKADLEAQVSS